MLVSTYPILFLSYVVLSVHGRKVKNFYFTDTAHPDVEWVPPVDKANDLLLIGRRKGAAGRITFDSIKIEFRGHGCGGIVRKFGDRSLIVANGRINHYGYNYLMEW